MDEKAAQALSRAYEQADAHVEEAVERARILRDESDRRVDSANAHIAKTVTEAQHAADNMLRTATAKAQRLASRTDELASSLLREAELQLTEARHRKSMLNTYIDDVRIILNEDPEKLSNRSEGRPLDSRAIDTGSAESRVEA
jgi:cell division septum initiation protein DivIVA